jgi:hypothetical protein
VNADVRTLVRLLRRNPMASRAEAERNLGHAVAWWDWKEAHVTYYQAIGRRDLARIARQ